MAAQNQNRITILRCKQVEARTGLCTSTIYARIGHNPKRPSDSDPTFPKPISIGAKAVGWIEAEIDEWLNAQVEKSRIDAKPVGLIEVEIDERLTAQVEKSRKA